jgi:divalent metal cation (Fe/Co/Zn/Cd) transporter
VPGITGVTGVRMRWLGHRLTLEATVVPTAGMPVEEFHVLEHEADHAIRHAVPNIGEVRLMPTVQMAAT